MINKIITWLLLNIQIADEGNTPDSEWVKFGVGPFHICAEWSFVVEHNAISIRLGNRFMTISDGEFGRHLYFYTIVH